MSPAEMGFYLTLVLLVMMCCCGLALFSVFAPEPAQPVYPVPAVSTGAIR